MNIIKSDEGDAAGAQQHLRTQHGARSSGKLDHGDASERLLDQWSFLHEEERANKIDRTDGFVDIRSVLAELSADNIDTLDVLDCGGKADVLRCFYALVGYLSGSDAAQLNPFIGQAADKPSAETVIAECGQLSHPLAKQEVEDALRIIGKHNLCALRTIIVILNILPEQSVTEVRRILARSLEEPERERGWSTWKHYVGSPPEDEEQRKHIRTAYKLFMWVIEEFVAEVLSYIKSSILNKGNDDVLVIFQRWKTIKTYLKMNTTREEILERERILHRRVESAAPMLVSWETRRQHLNKLLDVMQIPPDVIDRYFLPLNRASDYEAWWTSTSELLAYAEVKGIIFEQRNGGTSVKQHNERPDVPLCRICKRRGHSAEQCRTKEEKQDADTNEKSNVPSCRVCKRRGHSAEQCRMKKERQEVDIPFCTFCKKGGHSVADCHFKTPAVVLDTHIYEVDNARPLLPVQVRDGADIITFTAALDTCSNANFICAKARKKLRQQANCPTNSLISIGTIQDQDRLPMVLETVKLEVSLRLSDGNGLPTTTATFYVTPGDSIPGGGDVLLSSKWILDHHLWIKGDKEGFTVLSTALTIEEDPVFSEDEDFLEDDLEMAQRIRSLRPMSLALSHLSESELQQASANCVPVPVRLKLQEGADHPPCVERGYPTSDARVTRLIELLDTLESEDIIARVKERSGKFLFPGFGVRKGVDKVRLVVNLKGVNRRLDTFDDVQHHDVQTWLAQLPSWATHYSVLDVKDAFYHLPVEESSQEYLHMSIWTRQGYREYRWRRCPQGLSVAPSWWCEHIERCVRNLLDYLRTLQRYEQLCQNTTVILYADDILVCGRTESATNEMSEIIYQFLAYNYMYVPAEKFQRCSTQVEVMGLTLTAGTVSLGPQKTEKVLSMKKPRSRKELSSALGLLNYVRHWQKDRLSLGETELQHLFSLRDSKNRFVWDSRHDRAWAVLVDQFQNLPLYSWSTLPGTEDNHRIAALLVTDASDIGIGYACFLTAIRDTDTLAQLDLQQLAQEEKAKLVLAGSRRLTTAERNYVSFDKEGLSIYTCLTKARPFLMLAERSILLTDSSNALVRMLRTDQEPSLTRGRRWIRWLNDLSDVLLGPRAVQICHIPGQYNYLADYLSRYALADIQQVHQSTQTAADSSFTTLATVSIDHHRDGDITEGLYQALRNWDSDKDSLYLKCKLKDIVSFLKDGVIESSSTDARDRAYATLVEQVSKRFIVRDGMLLYKHKNTDRIVVPDNNLLDTTLGKLVPTRLALIRYFHESGPLASHKGVVQTLGTLRATYWFPSMDRKVSNWIATCEPCQIQKAQARHDSSSPIIDGPNHVLYMDWAGPFNVAGSTVHILIMVDGFSMFGLISVYDSKSALHTCDGLFTWCSILGTPLRWSSDNDTTFTSQVTRSIRRMLHIEDIPTPAYTPSTEGCVERKVKDLKDGINKFSSLSVIDSMIEFQHVLRCVVWGYNSTIKYGTSLTPFEVMLGRTPYCPLGVLTHGITEGTTAEETVPEYTDRLRHHLSTIQSYWQSKVLELRNRANDNARDYSFDFPTGTRCIRVIYVNGRRICVSPLTVLRPVGTNLFQVVSQTNKIQLVPSYQLVPLLSDSDRQLFEQHPDMALRKEQLIQESLRIATPGTIVAIDYPPDIYFGQLLKDYQNGQIIDLVFLVPMDRNGKFRFAKSRAEIDRFTRATDISDILLVDVPFEETSTPGVFLIRRDHFGGHVVS